MKKLILTLFTAILTISVGAQTIGEAFYVYRNDGMINTFFRSEIDSIAYSYYDADSLLYDEIVSQVVYTPDSIYQIPLAVIDSVGFVTPETKYQPGVIRLEGEIRNYIIGSDSLTVYFRSDTPNDILPKVGDKLVTIEMSEIFYSGFAGQVNSIERNTDSIIVNCSSVRLNDIFEVFYYTNNGDAHTDENKTRTIAEFSTGKYSPGTFHFPLTTTLERYLKAEKFGFSFEVDGGSQFEIDATPTYSCRGSIVVHPFWGVVVTLDVFSENKFSEFLSFSGSLSYSPDLDKEIFTYPIPAIPFIQVYGKIGPLFKAEIKGSLNESWSQTMNYHLHYENATNPLYFPVLVASSDNNSYTHEGQRTFEGSFSGGVKGEIGLKILHSDLASAGFGFDTGLKLSGEVLVTPEDIENSLTSTDMYNKLKNGLDLDFFFNLGWKTKFFDWCEYGAKYPIVKKSVTHFNLVPSFTNTLLSRYPGEPSTLIAYTLATEKLVSSVDLGFILFKHNETIGLGSTTCNYKNGPQELCVTYDYMSLASNYELYPTVRFFGINMLATPSAELETSLKAVTLHVEDITETTAKVWGRIEEHELIDEIMEFGLGCIEKKEDGGISTTEIQASSVDENGLFSVLFVGLNPNKTYKYYAYLTIDGETYYGEDKEFTTKKIPDNYEAYTVLTNDTITFYYDDKRKQRQGIICSRTSNGEKSLYLNYNKGWLYNIKTAKFDSSFANYYATNMSGSFAYCTNMTEIIDIKYLKTDSVTDMREMFYECRSLKNIDLSHFNTSKVKDMSRMFYVCWSLNSLDLSSFNTSNVTNMFLMFYECRALENLDLSSFNTTKVSNMHMMFDCCNSLINGAWGKVRG